ncbi:hypothetical protein, partial [Clostridium tyrobutyricum]
RAREMSALELCSRLIYTNLEVATMANKYKVKNKEYVKLGIKKNSNGDFEYINPGDKSKSKYKTVRKES